MIRHASSETACRVCGGHSKMPSGQGTRCWGLPSKDGFFTLCTNDRFAGGLPQNPKTHAYAHRIHGPCKCGVTHGEVEANCECPGCSWARRDHLRLVSKDEKAAKRKATPFGAKSQMTAYDYTNAQGDLIYQVLRWEEPGCDKTFTQRRPDGQGGWISKLGDATRVLYRLPEMLEGISAGDEVWIVEGEKDVNSLHEAGMVATCNCGGSGGLVNFTPEMVAHLADVAVVIVRDRDKVGAEHAEKLRALLEPTAKSIRIVEAKQGKDATDHLRAGCGLADFVHVWPPVEHTFESNPIEWKRGLLRSKGVAVNALRFYDEDSALAEPDLPTWRSGLQGGPLKDFAGMVVVSGKASAAKSYVSVASTTEAALLGWHVLYVTAELGAKQVYQRVKRYMWWRTQGRTNRAPDGWGLIYADLGAKLDDLIEMICAHVDARNTLIVFDSLSSFVDNAENTNPNDTHNITPARKLAMWCKSVKTASTGKISFILLSEINAQGESKGRFLDHKADIALAMESLTDQQQETKKLTVTKSNGTVDIRTGPIGEYQLHWESSTLTHVPEVVSQ